MPEIVRFTPDQLIEHLDTFKTAIRPDDVPHYVSILDTAYDISADDTHDGEIVGPHAVAASRIINDFGGGLIYFTNLLIESKNTDPFDFRLNDWSFNDEDLKYIRLQIVRTLRRYVTQLRVTQTEIVNSNRPPVPFFISEIAESSRAIDKISEGLEEGDS